MLSDFDYDKLWHRPDDLALTGEGSVIAIIDQPLWRNHPGYKDNLLDVQSINNADPNDTSMLGSAVVSIAVGEIGVARDAKILYRAIETWRGREKLLANHADALRDLQVYVNEGHHLDAISTSHGWKTDEKYADENDKLTAWFEKKNVPVFSVNSVFGNNSTATFFYPCGPDGLAQWMRKIDPNYIIEKGDVGIVSEDRLLASKDPRMIDEFGGLYYRSSTNRVETGGASLAVPFVAGLFALAREALPEITRDDFIQTLRDTTRSIDFGKEGVLPVADMDFFATVLKHCPTPLLRKRYKVEPGP